MRLAAALLGALLILPTAASAAASAGRGERLVLDHIVVVERHGVRSPTQAPRVLSQYSEKDWPDWPVAPGILTDHGQRGVAHMGTWLRADYARRGLWPAKGCLKPGSVYAWADSKTQRTRVSGQAALDGAFPGCGLHDAFGPEDQVDGIFSAIDAGNCPIDADQAKKAVIAQAGGDLDVLGADYARARTALYAILGHCLDGECVPDVGNEVRGGKEGLKMTGLLATGSTLTENLYLEYVQGMPPEDVGWGRAGSAAAIASVMPLHNISSDLMRRTPYLASHNGALMARAVLAAMQGAPALPGQGKAGSKLVLIAGHDTNLSNLSGILGVDWTLKDQPDNTPPGAALIFEVWKNRSGARFVRLALVYQTLDQLRSEEPLTAARPARRVELAIPGCADGPAKRCSLAAFRTMIEARLPQECPLDLATVESAPAKPKSKD